MPDLPAPYDLIIVGLGPVGLFAANVFGQKGWKVLAIEQHQKAWPYPRAIAMDDEVLRAIQSVDLLEVFQTQTRSIQGLQFLHRENEAFFTTAHHLEGDFSKGPYLFYQPELEAILKKGTQRFPNVTLQWGTRLDSFEAQANRPVLCHLSRPSGEKSQVFCSYLLGCDGANSTVRKRLNIQENNLNYEGHILKIDAQVKDANLLSFKADYAQKYCSPSRPWVRMRGKGQHCRWEFQFKDHEVENLEQVETDGLRLIQQTGENIDNIELIHSSYYRYRSVVQQTWRKGKVMIAGDAAHLTPPYIGQGMCSGFRDIVNLSWKLEAIHKQTCSETLLDTYDSERIPHMTEFIKLAILVGRVFKTRWYYLLFLLSRLPFIGQYARQFNPKNPRLGLGCFSQLKTARCLFPQFYFHTEADTTVKSDDYIGPNWTFLSIKQLPKVQQSAAQQAGIPILYLDPKLDKHSVLHTWFRRHQVSIILLRPDKYCFGGGHSLPRILQA
ncbi:MAG: FAD-dependent monooxygenase, partial [Bacteroidota bacterium]